MTDRSAAEEHLRVIRSLMERSTIYRTISAEAAAVGGLTSVLFGGWLYFHWRPLPAGREEAEFGRWFIVGWLAVLLVTATANACFIWKAAHRRKEPFISPSMRKALWALFPSLLCGGFFTFFFGGFVPWLAQMIWVVTPIYLLPSIWMIFYGLGLLATTHFAPRSIPLLGWFFLLSGLASFVSNYWLKMIMMWGHGESHLLTAANILMTITFGFFHLIYAACTWPRRSAQHDSGATP